MNYFERIFERRVMRFLISGGLATAADLLLLYYFAEMLGWWYLDAAIAAFLLAFLVSFSLQKLWTFGGEHALRKREQLPRYLAVNLANLGLNTAGMYVLVDLVGAWYLLSQIIISGLLAVSSFFIYKLFIFAPLLSLEQETND